MEPHHPNTAPSARLPHQLLRIPPSGLPARPRHPKCPLGTPHPHCFGTTNTNTNWPQLPDHPANSYPTSYPSTKSPRKPDHGPPATEHNHPPARGASPTQTDSDTTQHNRTAITTSPYLTLKRRARTTEDRNITQAAQKETQRQQRRTTRSTLADAAPIPPRWPCCNARCAASRTPLPEGFRCARTGSPMHYACAASPTPDGACSFHSCADPSPS